MSSHLKRLTRRVLKCHSNPWSAWTHLLSTPLVFVPFWTRSPRHAALVGAWMVLNPIVFPKPKDDSDWATRAMLLVYWQLMSEYYEEHRKRERGTKPKP